MARSITGVLFCAKCHKPVERLETGIDPWTGGYSFTAFCHGETDVCVIGRQEFINAISVDCVEAFREADSVERKES